MFELQDMINSFTLLLIFTLSDQYLSDNEGFEKERADTEGDDKA